MAIGPFQIHSMSGVPAILQNGCQNILSNVVSAIAMVLCALFYVFPLLFFSLSSFFYSSGICNCFGYNRCGISHKIIRIKYIFNIIWSQKAHMMACELWPWIQECRFLLDCDVHLI